MAFIYIYVKTERLGGIKHERGISLTCERVASRDWTPGLVLSGRVLDV